MISHTDKALVFDHDTLPARFILEPNELTVYIQGQRLLSLSGMDALALAQAVRDYYQLTPVVA